jgi:hypothetical protein
MRLILAHTMLLDSLREACSKQSGLLCSLDAEAWFRAEQALVAPNQTTGGDARSDHSTSNFHRARSPGSSPSIFSGSENSGFEETIHRPASFALQPPASACALTYANARS